MRSVNKRSRFFTRSGGRRASAGCESNPRTWKKRITLTHPHEAKNSGGRGHPSEELKTLQEEEDPIGKENG